VNGYELFSVSDIETFRIAFKLIAQNVKNIKENLAAIHIHFSMHGTKEGLFLSDKTFLNWKMFYEILKNFNDEINYVILPSGMKVAPTYLAFSVCDGFAAKTIKDFGEESPYTSLIGPIKTVEWSDSLLAFSIYYHNTILKKLGTKKALINMNEIIGNNIFQADPGKEIILTDIK